MMQEEIDHCEFWVTANRLVRTSGKHNFEHEKIQVNQEWDLDLMENWLRDYKDKEVLKYLKYRWPLNAHEMEINEEIPQNQAGARSNPKEVQEYLHRETLARSLGLLNVIRSEQKHDSCRSTHDQKRTAMNFVLSSTYHIHLRKVQLIVQSTRKPMPREKT